MTDRERKSAEEPDIQSIRARVAQRRELARQLGQDPMSDGHPVALPIGRVEGMLAAYESLQAEVRRLEAELARCHESARLDARFINDVRRKYNIVQAPEEFRADVGNAIGDLHVARSKLPPVDGPRLVQSAALPSPENSDGQ